MDGRLSSFASLLRAPNGANKAKLNDKLNDELMVITMMMMIVLMKNRNPRNANICTLDVTTCDPLLSPFSFNEV